MKPSRLTRAFTLIEVTLGLAILILIFGVIFQLVQLSMIGADEASRFTRRNREVDGFFAFLRQLCLDLPYRSQVLLEPRAGGSRGYDLVLSNASSAILPDRYDGTRVLRLELRRSEGETGSSLRLVEMFEPQGGGTVRTNIFPLMQEVADLRWWALDTRDGKEKSEWTDPVKPACLRVELVRREGGRRETRQGLFWIPAGLGPGGTVPLDPLAPQGTGAGAPAVAATSPVTPPVTKP